tara:strand:- start:125 stop:409 length:285 start_codon:yes stop_codon:yes gene_type:complete
MPVLRFAFSILIFQLLSGCAGAPADAAPPEEARAASATVDYSHLDRCLAKHLRGGLYNYAAHLADPESRARWAKQLEIIPWDWRLNEWREEETK